MFRLKNARCGSAETLRCPSQLDEVFVIFGIDEGGDGHSLLGSHTAEQ